MACPLSFLYKYKTYGVNDLNYARRIVLLIIISFFLPSCARLHPDVIQAGSNDYNIAMQGSRDEQMLLNLVRLKYHDTPYFLEASSVASQFRLATQVSASADLEARPIRDTIGLGGNISFNEQPTITYTPLQGNDFVQRLLIPVSLDTILLLINSGWSIERVLRMTVERINGIPNAPSASGPTPKAAPEYETFLEIVSLLEEFRKQDKIGMLYKQYGDKAQAVLSLDDTGESSAQADELRRLLGVNGDAKQYKIVEGKVEKNPDDAIVMTTRSLLGILFYLSHSVEVPETDRESGIVTKTYDRHGKEFDWSRLTQDLFKIHSESSTSNTSMIKTSYRGKEFYIDDRDLNSKSTFTLLTHLFSLQAGNSEGLAPVLTIPVGQ